MNNCKRKKILEAVAWGIAGVTLVGAIGYFNFVDKDPTSNQSLTLGDKLYEITFLQYEVKDGEFQVPEKEFSLDEYDGKVRLVNFWGIWCGGCKDEMPYFGEFAAKHPEVEVITIDRTLGDPTEKTCAFLNKNAAAADWKNYDITFVYDKTDDGAKKGLFYDLNFSAMPSTFILDESGTIVELLGKTFHSVEELEEVVLPYTVD